MVDIEVLGEDPVQCDDQEGGDDNDQEPADEFVEHYDFSIYEEGETKFQASSGFGGKQHFGCFGPILMYFVHKNQEKARRNHRSLISRNQNFRKEIGKSVR